MRGLPVLALALTALCGAAAPAADRVKEDPLARALAGRVPGKPVSCIDPQFTDGPQIIDDHTLIYNRVGRRVWRNDLPDACPALRPDVTIIVEMYGGQLCENDRFRVLEPGSRIPSASCRFGRFTPYDKPQGAK